MKGVLDCQISRDTSANRETHFQKRCLAFAAVTPNVLSKECWQLSDKVKVKVKVKVNFTLEQATKAQRESRGIALLFL